SGARSVDPAGTRRFVTGCAAATRGWPAWAPGEPGWRSGQASPACVGAAVRPGTTWRPQFDTGLHGRHERHQESWEGVTSDGPDPSTPLDGRRRRPRRGLLPDRLARAERAPDRPPRYPRPGGGVDRRAGIHPQPGRPDPEDHSLLADRGADRRLL